MAEKKDANLHENHRARMQARVARDGLDSLAEHEALEYLLFLAIPRQDTNALAHRLIQHFGSFCRVMEAEEQELLEVEGIGPKSARLIHVVMDFNRYYALKKRRVRIPLDKTENAVQYLRPLFMGQQNELLYIIMMDDNFYPVQDLRVAEGIPNQVQIDTAKMLRQVARSSSTCVLLAHNHPTGLAIPSQADIITTFAIMHALAQIGVLVLDHIIISQEGYCSLQDRGRMPEYRPEDNKLIISAMEFRKKENREKIKKNKK